MKRPTKKIWNALSKDEKRAWNKMYPLFKWELKNFVQMKKGVAIPKIYLEAMAHNLALLAIWQEEPVITKDK